MPGERIQLYGVTSREEWTFIHSARRGILRIVWKSTVHYRVHKSPPVAQHEYQLVQSKRPAVKNMTVHCRELLVSWHEQWANCRGAYSVCWANETDRQTVCWFIQYHCGAFAWQLLQWKSSNTLCELLSYVSLSTIQKYWLLHNNALSRFCRQ